MEKKSLLLRNISDYYFDKDIKNYNPDVGDVCVFRIISLGQRTKLQCDTEKIINIFEGDYIICVFGNRYATSDVEAYVPSTRREEYHLIGSGGIVGIVKSKNDYFKHIPPTKLELISLVKSNETKKIINTINTSNYLEFDKAIKDSNIILSLGSSMDSGKTTTAGLLINHLKMKGKKVAYMKLTGTAFTKDKDFALDYGADIACDFSDIGYPSTFLVSIDEIINIYIILYNIYIKGKSIDYLIIEIADGILQKETKALLENSWFKSLVDYTIFSAGDSLSAIFGYNILKGYNFKILGLSGCFTMSKLLIQEVKDHILDINIYHMDDFSDKKINIIK